MKKWIRAMSCWSLLLGLVGSCTQRESSKCVWENQWADSLEIVVQDSLYSNLPYSRSLLRNALAQVEDSLVYYRLLALYGKTFFASSDFDTVFSYNARVLDFSARAPKGTQWNDIVSGVYNVEGNVWLQLNHPDSAILYYRQAYDRRLEGACLRWLPDICINLADAYLHKGDLARTASYYQRALFLCDSLHLSEHTKFPIYYGLGQTYMDLRDFELSDHFYEMAGKFFGEMNVAEKYTYLNNRGNNYYYRQDYPKALEYMHRANRVVSAHRQMVFEQNLVKVNLGELYLLTNRPDSAQMCLDESYRFFSQIQHNSAVYYIETQMIELALQKGDVALAHEMIERTTPAGHLDPNMLTIRNRYLQHYFERVGDYRNAYEYQKRDRRLDDSIRSERVQARVAELAMRYRQDTTVLHKEMQLQRQAGEVKTLKLSVYIGVLLCALLAAGIIGGFHYMRKKRELLRERFFRQINRVRMENLRSRVSPHFTFNVLGREINTFEGSEEVKNRLMGLVRYLRRSLELTEKLSVSLQDELDFVRSYIELNRSHADADFTATVTVEEGLDTGRIYVPSMIVQIPVENAIKHGLAGMEGKKVLEVRVVRSGEGILITVCDNGRGYFPQSSSASSTRGTGTGLKVLYQTIQLLNAGNKNEKIQFNITNRSDGHTGTWVSVRVPFCFSYEL